MVFGGALGQNLAFALVALGLVEGTALVFYEVGLTEDRDRARRPVVTAADLEPSHPESEAKPREDQSRTGVAKPPHAPEGAGRVRLERMRGRPRRLR